MIYDVLEVFRKEYEQKGDKLILDNYVLKDGLYARIHDNDSTEYFIAKTVKKERQFLNLDGSTANSEIDWFKKRDYYSGYLNSNKAFDDKKIHNVNYLSFFAKVESFNEKSDKRLADNAIKEQYRALCGYKKFKKDKERKALKQYENYLKNRERRKDLIKKYRFVESRINEIAKIAVENGVTNYIKLFFEAPVEQYKQESTIYYSIKIFNDIEYCKNIGGGTYGLSDSNMGLNAKKPYLEHKTRKLEAPFMITDVDALTVKKFFDWLKYQTYQNKYPSGNSFFINRDYKEQDVIVDFDHLPTAIDRLEKPIYLKNHLQIIENKTLLDDDTIGSLGQLEAIVDEVLYSSQLMHNYYGEVYNKLDKTFASLIYITREAMINYFKKFDDRGFYQIIKRRGLDFVLFYLRQDRELKAKKCLNLVLSLQNHNKGETMDIQGIQKKIVGKLESSNYDALSSEEFFYLCGQTAKYLLSQSERHDKNADMLEPYLRANNSQKLKQAIEADYFKYKHKIPLSYGKLGNAIALVMAYGGDEKLHGYMGDFLVGVLSQNIFFMKKEDN